MDPHAERHAAPTGLTGPPPAGRRPAGDPLVGWRYWQVERGRGLLRSVTHRQVVWPPGRPLRAACRIGGHAAPAAGCACGIHAAPDLAALRAGGVCVAPGEALVVGTVALWGLVVADDHGLRAEYAAPVALDLVAGTAGGEPGGQAGALERLAAYGVPTGVVGAPRAVGEITAAVLAFQSMSR